MRVINRLECAVHPAVFMLLSGSSAAAISEMLCHLTMLLFTTIVLTFTLFGDTIAQYFGWI